MMRPAATASHPKKHQFKKGQSGNRKGRPKGAHSIASLFMKGMDKPVNVTRGSVTKTMSYRAVLVEKVLKDGYDGDAKARALIFAMEERCRAGTEEAQQKRNLSGGSSGQTVSSEELEFLSLEMLNALLLITRTLDVIRANLPRLHQMRAEEDRLKAKQLEDLRQCRMRGEDD